MGIFDMASDLGNVKNQSTSKVWFSINLETPPYQRSTKTKYYLK